MDDAVAGLTGLLSGQVDKLEKLLGDGEASQFAVSRAQQLLDEHPGTMPEHFATVSDVFTTDDGQVCLRMRADEFSIATPWPAVADANEAVIGLKNVLWSWLEYKRLAAQGVPHAIEIINRYRNGE